MRLTQRLVESGVDLSLLQRGREHTTLAVATLDSSGAATYGFYAEGTADRLVADPGALPESVRALSFGTLSLLYEPGASVYEALLHRVHADGRLTMLDPNIRPLAIADPSGYRARFAGWLPSVDVLKVSEDDADWLSAGPADTGFAHWLDAGVGAVLLTRGGDGLSVITREFRCDVPAPDTVVADTIGAGIPSTVRRCTGSTAATPSIRRRCGAGIRTTGSRRCGSPSGRLRSPFRGKERTLPGHTRWPATSVYRDCTCAERAVTTVRT